MRLLIFDLRPQVLEAEGLAAALEARLKSVEERSGLKTGLKVRLLGRLPAHVEDELYRIAQEALNNVLKHAQATQVNLHLIQTGTTLLMRIEDDGVGFDPVEKDGTGKLGLRAMVERARMIGGALSIESQPGAGARINLEVSF
jgi:signal transduction histidine kinase